MTHFDDVNEGWCPRCGETGEAARLNAFGCWHEFHGEPAPECNGICLTGSDIGVPSDAIAAAHPDCPKHGHMAIFNTDGTPRT